LKIVFELPQRIILKRNLQRSPLLLGEFAECVPFAPTSEFLFAFHVELGDLF
jgi:hypothetical protein